MEKNVRVETTTLSSKGQVVLPQEVRERLQLKEGAKFMVMAEGDTVILKAVKPITQERFDAILKATRKAVKKAGITPKDVEEEIAKVRQKHANRS